MLTLHHLNDSRSQRIAWLLELAGLEYEIKAYKRDPETSLAPDALKRVHPLGTSPIVTHNELVLPESGAICEYISTLSECSLIPAKQESQYFDVQFWAHYAEGSFMPPLVTSMVLSKARERVPLLIKPIANKLFDAILDAYFNVAIDRNFSFVESHLEGRTWLSGDNPTIADVQMSFALEAVYDAKRLKRYPNMHRYVEHLRSQASYVNARQRLQSAEKSL